MRYYISDCHFGHTNIITKMDKRKFVSVEEMDEFMIDKWNQKVRRNDEVIILGDFGFINGEKANYLLNSLNGKKYLIRGNHDRCFLDDKSFNMRNFEWIKDYAELNDNKRVVVLSHYPIIFYNGQYRRNSEGNPNRYMLYGHLHNTLDEQLMNQYICETRKAFHVSPSGEKEYVPCNMINTFCMFSDYTPLTLDEWIAVDTERRERTWLCENKS